MDTINIALAGDHSLNLHALATLLRQQSGFRVVSISKDAGQLADSIALGGAERYPHIVLLDINFDLHRAAGIVSALKTTYPAIRLAALGLTKDRGAILRLVRMGVDSYIPKNTDPSQLEEVLRQLASKGNYTTPLMEEAFGESVTAWPAVTASERWFFRLALTEATDEDIRRRMNLCESSFTRLVKRVYRHFGVRSRNGLVLALYRNRFVIMDDL
jgi:DNA-binding NarL/FixJ family response regulator